MEELDKDFKKYIDNVASNIHTSFLKKINDKLYLNDNELMILDKYKINYKSCSDYNNLLYLIDEILEDSYDDLSDLEEISRNIAERNYYQYTNK